MIREKIWPEGSFAVVFAGRRAADDRRSLGVPAGDAGPHQGRQAAAAVGLLPLARLPGYEREAAAAKSAATGRCS